MNVFTEEELLGFGGVFGGARAYDGSAEAKIDLGKFYLVQVEYGSNMGGGKKLMVWDKTEMQAISHLDLSSNANTQYYESESKTTMLGENQFESITKTFDYNDNSKEEKKTQIQFDPETGQFSSGK